MKGIDCCYHQGTIDFKKVKAAGINFIIPRDGWGTDDIDPKLCEYVKGAQAAGIDVPGVYHFIYGINKGEAIKNAQRAIQNVQAAGLPKSTIIWCDLEDDTVFNARDYRGVLLTEAAQKEMAIAFCDYILSQGYCTGIYLNQYYYTTVYGPEIAQKYDIWLADLEGAPYCRCLYRQYEWYGRINGIAGNVDLNEYYGQYTAGTAKKKGSPMTRQDIIEKYCNAAIKIAADDTHGYSNTVGSNLGPQDYDCGGFVSECLHQAGVLPASVWIEPNERYGNPWSYGHLEEYGFERLLFRKENVERGDILIKDGHHVELALGAGRQIGAHDNYDGMPGDYSHLGEISEVALSGYWDWIYRLKEEKEQIISPYTDVSVTDDNFNAIKWCYDKNILTGYDGQFKPDKKLTRRALAYAAYKYLVNTGKIKEERQMAKDEKSIYKDIKTTDTAYKAIKKMHELGIMKGYSDGKFRPNRKVSRKQLAVVLYRLYNAQ